MRLLYIPLLPLTTLVAFPMSLNPIGRTKPSTISMGLSKANLHFDFTNVPFIDGIRHIHSPEHITPTHRFGTPSFKIQHVDPPVHSDSRNAISFTCQTLLSPHGMRVRMYTSRPDESNLLFFQDGRALYGVKMTATPLRGFQAHRLSLDITFFTGSPPLLDAIKAALPVVLLVHGLEDAHNFHLPEHEDPQFAKYRSLVLGDNDDERLLLAKHVMAVYSGHQLRKKNI